MNEGWWKRREQPGPPPLIHIHFFIKSNFQFEFDWKKLNGMAWLAHRPSIKLIPSILINGRAAQGRSKLHFFSSPIRKNELKRKEVLLLGCRYISASSTASSHQSTKYLFDFDLRLFPQHRYTYCYNTFLFHQIQQIKRFIEFTERKKKFILFLFDWRELMNCWFVIAAPFIEEINFFKLRGGWL